MPLTGLSGNTNVQVTAAGMRSDAGRTGPLIRFSDEVLIGRQTPARSMTCWRSATLSFLSVRGPFGTSVSGSGPKRPLAHPVSMTASTLTANEPRIAASWSARFAIIMLAIFVHDAPERNVTYAALPQKVPVASRAAVGIGTARIGTPASRISWLRRSIPTGPGGGHCARSPARSRPPVVREHAGG